MRHHILRRHGISIKSTIGKNLIVKTKSKPFLTVSIQEGHSVEVQEGATVPESATLQEGATLIESGTLQEGATLQEGETLLESVTLIERETIQESVNLQEGGTIQESVTLQESEILQNAIFGQEDMISEKEEAMELISQGLGYMKFRDNFRNWLKTEKRIKHRSTKKYSDCCSNLIQVHGIRENVETYLRNAEEYQSKTTYNLKYWTVMYVNEFLKNTQGFEFFNF